MSNLEMNLPHLDFELRDLTKAEKSPASEVIRPTSFQTLLSQNEDLAARLRVAMQKLAELEEKNQSLQQVAQTAKAEMGNLFDQVLIWKEKEKLWKTREHEIVENQKIRERELDIEASLLRQKTEQFEKLEEKLNRYQKYQEKIRTSVKPYLNQLKGYAKSLLEQTRTLNESLLQKEMLVAELNQRLAKLQASQSEVLEKAEAEKGQLIQMFEDERSGLREEISTLEKQVETYKEKSRLLDRTLERQDELENLVVAVRRAKEDQSRQFTLETAELRQNLKKKDADLSLKSIQVKDFETELLNAKKTIEEQRNQQKTTEEQLTSLRYIWTQKNQECDKQKLTIQSLEKINLELSQKLNSLREKFDVT